MLERSFGGSWEFNEIIGYIKLHFLGSQVRGEYFAVSKSRIVRTRTKVLDFQTWKLAPEIEVDPTSPASILESVRDYIAACRREVPRRYIDNEGFESIAPFVDWKALYDA